MGPEPEGIYQVRASHDLAAVRVSFDEDHLVPNAGLVAPALLAQRLDVAGLVQARVRLAPGPGAASSGVKAVTVLGAMLTGGDSIDDVDVLRAGAASVLFDDTRAPSTIGTWLRRFTWAGVRQLDAVTRETLQRAWAAGLGPADLAAPHTIDVDSTVCRAYGIKKQGCRFGYTKVRGYHPLLATLAGAGEVLHARTRGGNAGSARGAKAFLAETVSRARHAGATGPLTVRADAAFYSKAFLGAARTADVRFSVTVRMNRSIRAAIDAIDEHAWTPIPYWIDDGADVAEVPYTCFSGRHATPVRLIVRRVRPTPGSQLALRVVFDHHALVTDRDGSTLTLEADHRAHAQVELVIRDLKAGPLAHLPSGKLTAQRRLARARRPRAQPRPLDPQRRRRRLGPRHRRHPAPYHDRDARPTRVLRPPPAATRPHQLALASPAPTGAGRHRGHPRARLTRGPAAHPTATTPPPPHRNPTRPRSTAQTPSRSTRPGELSTSHNPTDTRINSTPPQQSCSVH